MHSFHDATLYLTHSEFREHMFYEQLSPVSYQCIGLVIVCVCVADTKKCAHAHFIAPHQHT